MAWEDDDPEEKAGTVARAFIGDDEGDSPEEPTVQNADEGSQAEPEPAGADGSEYMGQNQEQAPSAPQEVPSALGDAESSNNGEGEGYSAVPIGSQSPAAEEDDSESSYLSKPLTAPKMPTFAPYVQSQAPGRLAAAKAAFNPAAYKPSVARRVAAGLAGFAGGFGSRNAGEGLKVGEQITGAPLRRAQAVEAQKEAGLQSQIDADNAANATTEKTNKSAADSYNMQERDMRNQGYVENQQAQAEQRRTLAAKAAGQVRPETMKPDDPNDPVNGTWSGVNAKGDRVSGLSAPDAYLKTPAGKAAVVEDTIKRARTAGHPFSPEQESVVRSGGHVTIKNPTSIHIPSAEQEKYGDWKTAFVRDNKRQPTAAEIASYGHSATGGASKSLLDGIEKTKDASFKKAQDDFATFKDPGQYQQDLQDAQNEYEQRLGEATGQQIPHSEHTVDPSGNVKWGNTASPSLPHERAGGAQPTQVPPQQQRPAAPAPQQAQPQSFQFKGQSVQSGQMVMVDGKPAYAVGVNPQSGKLITSSTKPPGAK